MEKFINSIKKERLLGVSIGLVYLWFGALKFFPNLSPADSLAKDTIHFLTFGLIPDGVSIILLAIWEVGVGILLILNKQLRITILMALVHMAFTFAPLLFFPELSFQEAPFTLTLVGQYIVKNIIIISALLMVYPTSTTLEIADTVSIKQKKYTHF